MSLLINPIEPVGPVDVIDGDSFEGLLDEVTGQLNAQVGRLLDLAIWADANPGGWKGEGVWKLSQFLAWRAGVSPAMAANLVSAAERADELPHAVDAVRRGEMSLDQLMPIVRSVPAWADLQATSLAVRLTVPQVRRLVKETDWDWAPGALVVDELEPEAGDGGAAVVADEVEPAAEASAELEPDLNRVSYGTGPDGRWYLHADLDADLGACVETALDEARDSAFARLNGSANESNVFRPVSDVEGLVELAQRSLDTLTEPARRNRYRVNLYLETAGPVAPTLTTATGTTLPESISRLITCEGSIDPVFVENGTPISVGRAHRTIPERTRRTVLKRDANCCQVPGCDAGRGLEIHHIIHWSDLGVTDTWNLITLCGRHHRLHHKRRLGITGNADEPDSIVFTDHRGMEIRPSGANPISPNSPPEAIRGTFTHPIGERLDSRWVTFVNPADHPPQRPAS